MNLDNNNNINNNEENEKVQCAICNCELTEETAIYDGQGYPHCEECTNNYLIYCDGCDNYFDSRNVQMTYVESRDITLCSDCFENGDYSYCDCCNEPYHIDDLHLTTEDTHICENCLDNGDYILCEDCGMWTSNYIYNEENDLYYCQSCSTRHLYKKYSYHAFNDWVFFKSQKEIEKNIIPKRYSGYELECENHGSEDLQKGMALVYDNLNAVCMGDGSISSNGFEIVSHPQTLDYYYENEDKFRMVFEKLQELGYKSHDTNTCGLHFHISRPENDDTLDRIWLVLETYKEELIKFSRRSINSLTHWSSFLSDTGLNEEESKALYYIKKKKGNCSRYMALNLTNDNTIEFRLFRGTLNFKTFMASLELVNNIVELCDNEKIELKDITWDKITSTKYCKEYCNEKNIHTNKKIKDNSLKYLKLEKKRKNIMLKIIKIVNSELITRFNNIKPRLNKDTKYVESLVKIKSFSNDFNIIRDIYNMFSNLTHYYNYSNYDSFKSVISNNSYLLTLDSKLKIKELLEKGGR